MSSKTVNTFLSNDGGHNWIELAKGSHIYEISDHGNIILLAEDQKMTNEFKFTIDEGKNIKKFVFGESKFEIFNI